MSTKIEWADMTINPVVGCSHCSPGCDNCYAERFAARLAKNPKTAAKYRGVVDENGKWTGKVNFNLRRCWFQPTIEKLRNKKSQRIFIGSMTDVFRPIPTAYWNFIPDPCQQNLKYEPTNGFPQIDFYTDLMTGWNILTSQGHTVIFLTKHPSNMHIILHGIGMCAPFDTVNEKGNCVERMQKNTILMATVCNQAEANEKIPHLLNIPGDWKYGVSIEPMLGPVDLNGKLCHWTRPDGTGSWFSPVPGKVHHRLLDWIIVGGETGPGARPMHPDWVRSLRDQCQSAGVPFFFKSWGEWTADYTYDDAISTPGAYVAETPFARIGTRRAGRLLDGVVHNEFPEVTA